jgi:hypothetical protein
MLKYTLTRFRGHLDLIRQKVNTDGKQTHVFMISPLYAVAGISNIDLL